MRLDRLQRVLLTGLALGITLPMAERHLLAQAARRVDIVSTSGCLREQPAGTWMLIHATDPVKSTTSCAFNDGRSNSATPISWNSRFPVAPFGRAS